MTFIDCPEIFLIYRSFYLNAIEDLLECSFYDVIIFFPSLLNAMILLMGCYGAAMNSIPSLGECNGECIAVESEGWCGGETCKKRVFPCHDVPVDPIGKVLLRAYMGSSHGIGGLTSSALCSPGIALSCSERISRCQCNGAMLWVLYVMPWHW
jgi:hypothetical protein